MDVEELKLPHGIPSGPRIIEPLDNQLKIILSNNG
jgi:hypothetical protein